MESKMNYKFAVTFLLAAIFLVSMAFLTITCSFAIDYSRDSKEFNIEFDNLNSNTMNLNDISLRKNNIMFNINLNRENNINTFIFDIENKGNIDAYIRNITKSKLEDYLFSYNGKDYYLKDFVFYNVYYAVNNKDNNVHVDADLGIKDEIKSNTANQVVVKVRLKGSRELDAEYSEALDYYLSSNNIGATLYLDASFNEM